MGKKRLIVTGDRVLIKPDLSEERTKVGLYLPQTVKATEEVIGGTVVQTGPGIPLPEPSDVSDEPWQQRRGEVRYLPVQARPGDYALFLQKAGVEIQYDGEKYLIVPQSALLILLREDDAADEPETGENEKTDDLPFF